MLAVGSLGALSIAAVAWHKCSLIVNVVGSGGGEGKGEGSKVKGNRRNKAEIVVG